MDAFLGKVNLLLIAFASRPNDILQVTQHAMNYAIRCVGLYVSWNLILVLTFVDLVSELLLLLRSARQQDF